MTPVIAAYSEIHEKGVYKNGKLLLNNSSKAPFNVFARDIYQLLNPDYPKFFKMDDLCKLAFLAAEVLLSDNPLSKTDPSDIALVLGNTNSSIASDMKHAESIKNRKNYFPSPAVFVYTLPNIMLGEICIRHQITGETTCFIMEKFDSGLLHQYVCNLFDTEDYKYCITGYVDYLENAYSAYLFLIEKGSDSVYIDKFDKNFKKHIVL
ncbi:MAG: hypothetical protein ACK4ND_10315 [Cytophagaceae bacterium]